MLPMKSSRLISNSKHCDIVPEELDELEEEEREPLEEALEEEPLLESLFPPRFFFFSAALESLAFVRSRLLRLDAIVIRKFPFLVYQRFAAILLKIYQGTKVD